MRTFFRSVILTISLIVLALSGCSTPEDASKATGQYFEVTAEFTPFFKTGPGQARGPDLSLDRGRIVKMIKRGFGYSQIELENGSQGWVATSDLGVTTTDFSAATGTGTEGITIRNFDPGAIVERYYVDDQGNEQALPPEGLNTSTHSTGPTGGGLSLMPAAPTPTPTFDTIPQEVPMESLPEGGAATTP
jgi:hypothetical protein